MSSDAARAAGIRPADEDAPDPAKVGELTRVEVILLRDPANRSSGIFIAAGDVIPPEYVHLERVYPAVDKAVPTPGNERVPYKPAQG